ncbi:MAG: class I SAM-dependent methyltransferase, partial [Planctomycetes bacterium]|nr:class I SAM-dependent methyltransferase [Planctomycetota bacterium]
DVASLAIEQARARVPAGLSCRFATLDVLVEEPAGGPFDLVFDRGCFHVFDEPADRARLAARIAAVLAPAGVWLSLIGSTEGPPRDIGPPRRSLRDVVDAVEPHLEVVSLRSAEFRDQAEPVMAWICVARRRAIAAQPSSRHAP